MIFCSVCVVNEHRTLNCAERTIDFRNPFCIACVCVCVFVYPFGMFKTFIQITKMKWPIAAIEPPPNSIFPEHLNDYRLFYGFTALHRKRS